MMDARPSPFTHARIARAYQAERAMLDAIDQRDERAQRMLDRVLRAAGLVSEARPAQPMV